MGKCGECMRKCLPDKSRFQGLFKDMTLRKWSKYILFSMNCIIMLFSLVVIGLASAAINAKGFSEGPSPEAVIAALVICILCFIVAVIGIVGLVMNNTIILIVYASIIGTIFVVKLTLLIIFCTSGFDLDARFVEAYKQNGRDSALFDNLFRALECCGMNGTYDFFAPKVRNNIIPKGCCKESDLKVFGKTKICSKENRFNIGCNHVMGRSGNPISQKITGFIVLISLFLFVELFAISSALFLVLYKGGDDRSASSASTTSSA